MSDKAHLLLTVLANVSSGAVAFAFWFIKKSMQSRANEGRDFGNQLKASIDKLSKEVESLRQSLRN